MVQCVALHLRVYSSLASSVRCRASLAHSHFAVDEHTPAEQRR